MHTPPIHPPPPPPFHDGALVTVLPPSSPSGGLCTPLAFFKKSDYSTKSTRNRFLNVYDRPWLHKDWMLPGIFRLSFANSALLNFCDVLTTCFVPLSIPLSLVQACLSTPIKYELKCFTHACMPVDMYALK